MPPNIFRSSRPEESLGKSYSENIEQIYKRTLENTENTENKTWFSGRFSYVFKGYRKRSVTWVRLSSILTSNFFSEKVEI